jgi:hypothetical protein
LNIQDYSSLRLAAQGKMYPEEIFETNFNAMMTMVAPGPPPSLVKYRKKTIYEYFTDIYKYSTQSVL